MSEVTQAGFVAESVLRTAKESPERTALITRKGRVTYGELARRMMTAAGALRRAGLSAGDWLAIRAADEELHLTLSLAALAGGYEQVSLGSHESAEARKELLTRIPRCALVTDDRRIDAPCSLMIDAEGLFLEGEAATATSPLGGALFTSSGSTGRPKLAHFSRPVLEASFRRYRDEPGKVVGQTISVEHGVGKKRAWRTLLAGGTLVTAEGFGDADVTETCARHGVERLFLSSYALSDLADRLGGLSAPALPGLRIICAGSKIPASAARKVRQALGAEMTVAYGTTETGTLCLTAAEELENRPDTVGRPVAGIELRITDDEGAPLEPGAEGYVCVRGPGCLTGYLDGAEPRRFSDGWFRPGDVGRLEHDGTLTLLGREGDRMILNGMNIFPAEIERAALSHPGVKACAAFPIASSLHGEIPALAYVAHDALGAVELLAHCRSLLGPRAPRAAFRREGLPTNPQGKVLRQELTRDHGGTKR